MGLTQAEKAMIEKARAAGGGGLAEALEDSACAYLMWVIARDLSLKLKGLPTGTPRFFTACERVWCYLDREFGVEITRAT